MIYIFCHSYRTKLIPMIQIQKSHILFQSPDPFLSLFNPILSLKRWLLLYISRIFSLSFGLFPSLYIVEVFVRVKDINIGACDFNIGALYGQVFVWGNDIDIGAYDINIGASYGHVFFGWMIYISELTISITELLRDRYLFG